MELQQVIAGDLAVGQQQVADAIGAILNPSDFAISVSPDSVSCNTVGLVMTTVFIAVTAGQAQLVSFSVSGLPSGVSAAFSPVSVIAGGSTTLTLDASGAPPGSYVLTITGTGTDATEAATLQLTITGSSTGGL